MIVMTNGEQFIEAFNKKITELKEVLGTDLNVNVDSLIDELSSISTVSEQVKELKQAISDFVIPEVPDDINIKGLQDVADTVALHVKYLKELKDFKIPDVEVKLIDNQNIEKVISKLDDVIKESNNLV